MRWRSLFASVLLVAACALIGLVVQRGIRRPRTFIMSPSITTSTKMHYAGHAGHEVNVISAVRLPDGNCQTKMLVERVLLRYWEDNGQGPPYKVTLDVTAAEADLLEDAASRGSITFSLRRTVEPKSTVKTARELIFGERPETISAADILDSAEK